jgi:hypothetical protein
MSSNSRDGARGRGPGARGLVRENVVEGNTTGKDYFVILSVFPLTGVFPSVEE